MSTPIHRSVILALAALVAAVAFDAQARPGGGRAHASGWGHGGGWGHHHAGGGHWHWGVGVGIGFGGYWPSYPYGYYPYGYPYGYWSPGYVVMEQPMAEPSAPPAPEPTFVPKGGQSAVQYEADRRQCDREAMALPDAMADAAVFHHYVLWCMENRGYTVR
jgi:hypothetical protein